MNKKINLLLSIVILVMAVILGFFLFSMFQELNRQLHYADSYPDSLWYSLDEGNYGELMMSTYQRHGDVAEVSPSNKPYYSVGQYVADTFLEKVFRETGQEERAAAAAARRVEEMNEMGRFLEHAERIEAQLGVSRER